MTRFKAATMLNDHRFQAELFRKAWPFSGIKTAKTTPAESPIPLHPYAYERRI
jgi:hypothetical protein